MVLCKCFTYLAWVRLRVLIGDYGSGQYTEAAVRSQDSRTKAPPEPTHALASQVAEPLMHCSSPVQDWPSTSTSHSSPTQSASEQSSAGMQRPAQRSPSSQLSCGKPLPSPVEQAFSGSVQIPPARQVHSGG